MAVLCDSLGALIPYRALQLLSLAQKGVNLDFMRVCGLLVSQFLS